MTIEEWIETPSSIVKDLTSNQVNQSVSVKHLNW